ncbi:hypothetical protein GOBAR_DD04758 [Gossypium barbadense]|nr:hypothetical protein GOBAR_DD04758 [Gossypium barbadense]
MVALYCPTERVNTEPIQLFAELADVDPIEDVTSLRQQYGVEDLCTEVPRMFFNMRSFMHGFDIDLNVGCADQYGGGATSTWAKNPHHVRLQIHPVVIETDVHGEDGSNNNCHSDHESEDFSDPDVDEVSDGTDDEGADDENDYAISLGNPSHGIVIRNNRGAHISIVDPDTAYAFEFPKYPNIIPTHLMLVDPELEELFVGQRFVSKDNCIIVIKWYSMKVLVDYKVATLNRQYMLDHLKLDLKTMCNCILPMVKDMPTIPLSVLISELQERF